MGRGAFASVKRCIHKKTGHVVAIKSYDKKNLKDTDSSKALRREIFTLAMLDHKNIMSLHEVVDSRTNVHLIMELCEGKSLYHLIKKSNESKEPGLPEDVVHKIFLQLAEAVAYMHSHSIVHRDLKLENILINPQGEVKIIDFGFAVKCKQGDKLSSYCGTPHYMDPDLVKKHPYSGQGADVWALGVILYILLTGKLPFFAEFEADLFRKIQGAKYQYPRNYRQGSQNVQNTLSIGVKNVVKRILEPDVNTRPTARQILADPWLRSESGDVLSVSCQSRSEQINNSGSKHDLLQFQRNSAEAIEYLESSRGAGTQQQDERFAAEDTAYGRQRTQTQKRFYRTQNIDESLFTTAGEENVVRDAQYEETHVNRFEDEEADD